jgi:hypothetical protein
MSLIQSANLTPPVSRESRPLNPKAPKPSHSVIKMLSDHISTRAANASYKYLKKTPPVKYLRLRLPPIHSRHARYLSGAAALRKAKTNRGPDKQKEKRKRAMQNPCANCICSKNKNRQAGTRPSHISGRVGSGLLVWYITAYYRPGTDRRWWGNFLA